jgi:hypothetical protein
MNKQFIGNDFTKTNQAIDKLSPDKVRDRLTAYTSLPIQRA